MYIEIAVGLNPFLIRATFESRPVLGGFFKGEVLIPF